MKTKLMSAVSLVTLLGLFTILPVRAEEAAKEGMKMEKMDMSKMHGMMNECMDMHKDKKMCDKEMMKSCQTNMDKKDCEAMMKDDKKMMMKK